MSDEEECEHEYEPTIALDISGGTREFMECVFCHDFYEY